MATKPNGRPPDWQKIRAGYEAGEDVRRLAIFNSVKARTIRERAAAEGWAPSESEARHLEQEAARRAAQEKRFAAAGALRGLPPEQRTALVHDLLARYLQGETFYTMGRELNASRAALYYVLLGGADDEAHRDLITQALTARVARADEMLEQATGPVEIARAREMARFARMDYERRRPALYGQQSRVEHTLSVDLGERLRRARERVLPAAIVEALPAPEPVAETLVSEQGDES